MHTHIDMHIYTSIYMFVGICMHDMYIYTHTHTVVYIYCVYIYIYITSPDFLPEV